MQLSFRVSLHKTAQGKTGACSLVQNIMNCSTCSTAACVVLWKCMLSVHRVCVLLNSSSHCVWFTLILAQYWGMIADVFITLCAYAQQGYAFGCVGLCMCARMWPKMGCLGSYRLKNLLLVQFTACSLGLMAKRKAYYVRRLVTPVHVCAAGLCVQLFHLCICIYIMYVNKKQVV